MTTTIRTAPSCADDVDSQGLRADDAIADILATVAPVNGHERVALRSGLGRVLAAPVLANQDVPGHTNSAMDGFALIGTDLPDDAAEFELIGTAFAGRPFASPVANGQCVRIMTGAPMPEGTDTVVIQEHTEITTGGRVRIGSGHHPGQNVRGAGEDVRRGETVLATGHRIRPADLGVIASLGVPELSVYRRPRVAFFSTGDELRSIGEVLGPGDVFDSNRYSLYGMLTDLGVEVLDLGVVGDTPDAMRAAFEQAAANADVVITSGGVSVGEADFTKQILDELGAIRFWKIAMKPGRPLAFGQLGKAWFFGLPGNPVAVMVTFLQFVLPALKRLGGEVEWQPLRLKARSRDRLRKRPGRTEFQRGILTTAADGELEVSRTGAQGSGILSSMSRANCLIIMPHDAGPAEPGDRVWVQPLTNQL